jgi:hypothetical protein
LIGDHREVDKVRAQGQWRLAPDDNQNGDASLKLPSNTCFCAGSVEFVREWPNGLAASSTGQT